MTFYGLLNWNLKPHSLTSCVPWKTNASSHGPPKMTTSFQRGSLPKMNRIPLMDNESYFDGPTFVTPKSPAWIHQGLSWWLMSLLFCTTNTHSQWGQRSQKDHKKITKINSIFPLGVYWWISTLTFLCFPWLSLDFPLISPCFPVWPMVGSHSDSKVPSRKWAWTKIQRGGQPGESTGGDVDVQLVLIWFGCCIGVLCGFHLNDDIPYIHTWHIHDIREAQLQPWAFSGGSHCRPESQISPWPKSEPKSLISNL